MKKKGIIPRYKWLIIYMTWILSPIVILKILGHSNLWAMIVTIIIFHIPFLVLSIYIVFFYKTNYLAPWPKSKRNDWKPSKSDLFIDRFLRVTILFALCFLTIKHGSRLTLDLYDFAFYDTIISGKYLVVHKDGPGSWRVPNYYMTLKLMGTDEQEFVIFFYSPRSIEKGHRYQFDILPRSGIILRARPAT